MSKFFSKTHEQFPVLPNEDLKFCEGQITSISFSGLSKAEQCLYHLFLDKVSLIPGISGAAADRGSMLHNILEEFVNGTTDALAWSKLKSKVYHKLLIDGFKEDFNNGLCIPELKFAITSDLKITKWDAKNMWLRGAIDVVVFETPQKLRAAIYDYKSGRNSNSAKHRSQLLLYAMMMFLMYPKLEHIRSAPIYIDHSTNPFHTEFVRADFDLFWPRFEARFKRITNSTHFPPNPNRFSCQWCQHKVAQESLGQTEPACKFGV
jgi:hypothetical protein